MTKPLTYSEGFERGKEDHMKRNSYDPQRWIKAWSPAYADFERGYYKGFYHG